MSYYADKLETLCGLFGREVALEAGALKVGDRRYPILDDVVILLEPSQYPAHLSRRLLSGNPACPPEAKGVFSSACSLAAKGKESEDQIALEVQASFGEEWQCYGAILPEHEKEFHQYFDLVDLASLEGKRVCDLGCGNGRWSFFLKDLCRELVLVDFSEAIFVARENLRKAPSCLFFMADLRRLPFREGFADFLLCLGVLHHLPTPALEEVRRLKGFSPRLLIYLYYALDNRPFYFRWILRFVTVARRFLCRLRNRSFRRGLALFGTYFVYLPLVALGRVLQALVGRGSLIPLYDAYHNKSLARIQQDVYDRFFTAIEQRVTRREILGLRDTFRKVTVSDSLPYWHFLCEA